MVDNEVNRNKRIDFIGIPAQTIHRVTHRGKVDNARNARKVLKNHPRRFERDFHRRKSGFPRRDIENVFFCNFKIVTVSQRVFQKNADRIGQGVYIDV